MPTEAFVSYSHADEQRRSTLDKHLATLRRDGLLTAWSDHAILPGERFDHEISEALERSGLFLALLSPDYLNSRYCYEIEFQRAQELEAEGRLRIVGIVVEPCDWKNSPFRDRVVLPAGGKSVPEWTNENIAFLNVAQELRRLLERPVRPAAPAAAPALSAQAAPARRLKVKQDFDAIQKAEFADQAYDVLRRYFEASCAELPQASEHLRAKYEAMSATAFTCTAVNRAKVRGGEAHITVHNSKGGHHGMRSGSLTYVYQPHADGRTTNGWLTVEADEYRLFLRGSLDRFGLGGDSRDWMPNKVAVALWNTFMAHAGIEFE